MLLAFLYGCAVAAISAAITIYVDRPGWPRKLPLSPDGDRFLAMARGEKVARTYHVRWLLPWLLRERLLLWQAVTLASLVLTGGLVGAVAVAYGLELRQAVVAAALFAGLPIFRICVVLPVLTDAPALACLLGSVLLHTTGYTWLAVALAAFGATIKETVPAFAAAATLSPWLLLGLLLTAGRVLFFERLREEPDWATDPFGYARNRHAPHWRAQAMLLPWGLGLVALIGWPLAPELVASLAVAYAVIFVASDVVRNYQWGFVPVVVAAAALIPEAWTVPAVAAHWFWPWKGEL